MRAVRIVDGTPTLETLAGPEGDGVCVKVVSSSICGSDLHLLDGGIAEGMILGHEFCGIAPDGTPVAVDDDGAAVVYCRDPFGTILELMSVGTSLASLDER